MTDAPRLAPLGWGKRDPGYESGVRTRGKWIALRVLLETDGEPPVSVSLALGAACPFTSKHDKLIWLDAIGDARALKARCSREEIERLLRANRGGK